MMLYLSHGGPNVFHSELPLNDLVVATLSGAVFVHCFQPGDTWREVRRTLEGNHVSALAGVPDRELILAGTHGAGLYTCEDGGETWRPSGEAIVTPNIYAIAIAPETEGPAIYVGTEPAHLYRSRDFGSTWEELSTLRDVPGIERWTFPSPPHVAHVKHIAIDPRDSRTLFVSIEQGGLFKSSDAGESWRELDSYHSDSDTAYKDVHRYVINPSKPDTAYITGGEGLYMTEDNGETWQHLTTRSSRIGYPDALLVSPRDADFLILAGALNSPNNWRQTHTADSRAARSRDGGQNWEILERGLPTHLRGNIEAACMNVWPGGMRLFIGTTDGSVYCSDDQGERWTLIVQDLPPISKGGHYRHLRAPEEAAAGATAA